MISADHPLNLLIVDALELPVEDDIREVLKPRSLRLFEHRAGLEDYLRTVKVFGTKTQ